MSEEDKVVFQKADTDEIQSKDKMSGNIMKGTH